ncbi:hypothetical protein ACFUTY_27265 [Streptomyces sp. NPDC057362]|uniref:hypothetical protein n=1 Tax=Streptomyces sp. NPDC057362 TaxID=3346106 RepID=UPI00363DD8D9
MTAWLVGSVVLLGAAAAVGSYLNTTDVPSQSLTEVVAVTSSGTVYNGGDPVYEAEYRLTNTQTRTVTYRVVFEFQNAIRTVDRTVPAGKTVTGAVALPPPSAVLEPDGRTQPVKVRDVTEISG